jgi:hypothetical protein
MLGRGQDQAARPPRLAIIGFVILVTVLMGGLGVMMCLAGGRILLDWRASKHFQTTTGTVFSTDVQVRGRSAEFVPVVWYRYTVGGKDYQNWRIRIVGDYPTNSLGEAQAYTARLAAHPVTVWYDPQNPQRSALDLRPGLGDLVGIPVLGVMALGVTGVMVTASLRQLRRHPESPTDRDA